MFHTILLLLAVAITASAQQFNFHEANEHQHGALTTIEGQWVSREVISGSGGSQYMLGNLFTVQSGDRRLQFYRWFKADDAPLLSQLNMQRNAPVRVTYDPECGYAVAVELIGATPTVNPSRPPPPITPINTLPDVRNYSEVKIDWFPIWIKKKEL